jgi:hypothetical protein
MTDTETVVETEPQTEKPRPRRVKPKASRAPAAEPVRHPDGTIDRLAETERLTKAKHLDARLAVRAPGVEKAVRHNLSYNFPLMWYRRPDGDIVQLQSDPNNRAMYEDLGFVLLRPSEVREWEQEIRPEVILEQKHKARLITAIRRLETRVPQLVLDDEENLGFGDMDVDTLQEVFDDYCNEFSVRGRLPPIPPERKSSTDSNLAGVETNAMRSREEFEGKLQAGRDGGRLREQLPGQPRNFV